ncbi:MAG: adenylosuccinate lyase family protein [Rhodospirillales bacterium]
MPSTLIDSNLYKDLFGTEAMRAIFSDDGYIDRCVRIEAALAKAQGRLGVIPKAAAEDIAAKATLEAIDRQALKKDMEIVGRVIAPIVKQLTAACGKNGAYVHWGATTQDIMDTAVVLQIRDALKILEGDMTRLIEALKRLTREHRGTLMAGRTAGQQALPTTFGLKTAVWLQEMMRHQERLAQSKTRVLVGQFGGAVGTLASLGRAGLDVQAALMKELDLDRPVVTWHAARDRFVEICLVLAMMTASLGKIAAEIGVLMRTEVAEVFEGYVPGRGSSSTMPQKRNPRFAEFVPGIAKLSNRNAALMLEAMDREHERSGPPWIAEWAALPEIFILAAGALHQSIDMLEGLDVRKDRMRENLELTKGLILAEAAMMALAPHLSRLGAKKLVEQACSTALSENRHLHDVLAENSDVMKHLSEQNLRDLFDPANYIGLAEEIVDHALKEAE